MRSPLFVVIDPSGDHGPSVGEPEEQALVQRLLAHSTVEAFAEPVLHRLAWGNEMPGDLIVLRPGKHRVRGELRAVVGDDQPRFAAALDQR